jgi:competence protein ComEC
MISFVMTGKLIHRQINTYNMLFASAFLLLTISPALISDISFQLSFAAVLGIIIYQPVIYRLLAFKHAVADRIWQMFSVSCAAQLSTLPFTLYYFHQFPVYFWLTNLYVVPLVSVIICVAGVFLIVSSIDPLMQVVGKVLALLLAALYKAVAFTEILPFSLIENIHISGIQTVVLIAFILFLGLFSLQRKIIALWLALGLFIIFQFMNTLQALTLRNQRVFMAGDLKGFSAINLISGRDGMLLSDSTLFPDDPVLQYPFRNFWIRHGVANQIKCIKFAENVFFDFSGIRVVILKDNNMYKFHADNRLKADMVIVTGNMKPDLNTIVRLLDPELVILDASVQHYKAVKWIKECQQQGVKYWHVSQQGAYLLTIR